MERYTYTDPSGTYTYTRKEILERYYARWCKKMIHAGKEDMISEDLCIDDWIVKHWAFKIK